MSQGGGPGAAVGHGAVAIPADVQVGQFVEFRYKSSQRGQRLGTSYQPNLAIFSICSYNKALERDILVIHKWGLLTGT